MNLIGGYPSPEGVETAIADNTSCCFLERRRFCWHDYLFSPKWDLFFPSHSHKFSIFFGCQLIRSPSPKNQFISPMEGMRQFYFIFAVAEQMEIIWFPNKFIREKNIGKFRQKKMVNIVELFWVKPSGVKVFAIHWIWINIDGLLKPVSSPTLRW